MGDGVLVYFGYPQAHEDDAEWAVRAGLELIAAVSALKAPVSLQTRVGIATGLVVVGDLIGSGEAQERGIVGETQTSRLDCKGSPSRTQWSSPMVHESFSAISSNSTTSDQETSRASPAQCGLGRRYRRVLWKAASRRSTRPNLPL
jgi:hypothetical protein